MLSRFQTKAYKCVELDHEVTPVLYSRLFLGWWRNWSQERFAQQLWVARGRRCEEEKKKHYEKTKRVCRNTEITEIVQNLKDGKTRKAVVLYKSDYYKVEKKDEVCKEFLWDFGWYWGRFCGEYLNNVSLSPEWWPENQPLTNIKT